MRETPQRPAAARERARDRLVVVLEQEVAQTEIVGVPAEQFVGSPGQQSLAGAIDQFQMLGAVEREYGDVDLLHHLVEQRRRFDGAETLGAQAWRQSR